MKFIIRKASDWDYKKTKEIKTLRQLMMFAKKVKEDIIIRKNGEIMIYDNYIE